MKGINGKKIHSSVQNILRLFRTDGEVEQHPSILVCSEKANTIIPFNHNAWKLADTALLDAERTKTQAYMRRLHDSTR